MVEIKKHIWIFVFIGAIIALIALLTPAAFLNIRSPSFDNDFYLWMCNLFFSNRFEAGIRTTTIEFDINLISLIPSILCSGMIIIFSIITIFTANNYRKGVIDAKISWLFSAIVTIIATIIWIIMMEVSRRVLYGHEFWGLLYPSFGVIGPFIGAGLEIVGFGLMKKKLRSV
ncbi:MAG: hypothetical protein ACXABO_09635 [Promethearchaeota archaeon]|jgi:hypothetical protein